MDSSDDPQKIQGNQNDKNEDFQGQTPNDVKNSAKNETDPNQNSTGDDGHVKLHECIICKNEHQSEKSITLFGLTDLRCHLAVDHFKVSDNETSFFTQQIQILIFYTEILTRKVVLWCFFLRENE